MSKSFTESLQGSPAAEESLLTVASLPLPHLRAHPSLRPTGLTAVVNSHSRSHSIVPVELEQRIQFQEQSPGSAEWPQSVHPPDHSS